MIRIVIFLLAVGALALGVNWFADRPGEVAITWQNWRIETSVMMTVIAVVAICVLCVLLWSLIRALIRSPHQARQFFLRRRGRQGYAAISKGLIAIGAGDARAARRHAEEARRLAPGEPLTLLLGAQTAQMSGDRAGAERSFRAMAERPETKLIGLRGLFIEAQRHGDAMAARLYAEEAVRSEPALTWAGEAVLQFRSAAGDWDGALDMLSRNRRSGLLDRAGFQRDRAVFVTAQALALQDIDRDRSRVLALEAAKAAPDLIPAVALAARFLAESGENRKGARMIEKAWRTRPHPDLADAYANLRLGDSARDRLGRVQKLAAETADNIEGALAVARAAIAAREFPVAREVLARYLAQPTRRVALLMAELEAADTGDQGRAREWTARALTARPDPVWTADGFVSDHWLPMSPVSGRIGAFEWTVPPAAIEGAVREMTAAPDIAQAPDVSVPAMIDAVPEAPQPAHDEALPTPAPQAESAPRDNAEIRPEPRSVELIVPLAHVPDDPGPEPESEREPAPEAADNGWKRRLLGS
jgi:HemY protein